MLKKKLYIPIAFAAVLLLAIVSTAAQAQDITGVGFIYENFTYPNSYSHDISGDGSTVVGDGRSLDCYSHPFSWTGTSGLTALEPLTWNKMSEPSAVSGDGSVAVGNGFNADGELRAVLWNSSGQVTTLGELEGYTYSSMASGISADGSIVVGIANRAEIIEDENGNTHIYANKHNQAFIWTGETGMVSLGQLADAYKDSSMALGVSADGSVVVGKAAPSASENMEDQAFVWTEGSGMQSLGHLHDNEYASSATAISADGTTIVGDVTYHVSGEYIQEAFIWNEETGMAGLGTSLSDDCYASDISGDGSVVVGVARIYDEIEGENTRNAFIWTEDLGMVLLYDFLAGLGMEGLEGWWLEFASGISDDGLTITGSGNNPDGYSEGWVVHLDENTFSSVPVPGTFCLFGTGIILLTGFGRKKHRR